MKLTKKIVGALAAITILFAGVSTNALAGSHAKYPSKPIEKTITFNCILITNFKWPLQNPKLSLRGEF